MEKQLYTDAGIHATIHMDPIETRDPVVNELREQVGEILTSIDERLHMHDFRMVPGVTHSNLIFDVVVPFELKTDHAELKQQIDARVREINPDFCTVITFDRG